MDNEEAKRLVGQAEPSDARVLVQVVPVHEGREVGWGSNLTDALEDRLADVREAVRQSATAVADGLVDLPAGPEGWRLQELTATFGIALTAEAGVILTRASAATTFEVAVTFRKDERRPSQTIHPLGQRWGGFW
jgi:hypothetical protein